eukprot:TRINITY_DN120765_c0_g1_i1.p1 TRINITY_DN120765_c0_g1~~TRINITY_DN120765_c0_g1_i1.p1  ORF type:complete len:628 (+),score=113.78 TRINITY_DN120765_c0_g1_i1:177-2060(+)
MPPHPMRNGGPTGLESEAAGDYDAGGDASKVAAAGGASGVNMLCYLSEGLFDAESVSQENESQPGGAPGLSSDLGSGYGVFSNAHRATIGRIEDSQFSSIGETARAMKDALVSAPARIGDFPESALWSVSSSMVPTLKDGIVGNGLADDPVFGITDTRADLLGTGGSGLLSGGLPSYQPPSSHARALRSMDGLGSIGDGGINSLKDYLGPEMLISPFGRVGDASQEVGLGSFTGVRDASFLHQHDGGGVNAPLDVCDSDEDEYIVGPTHMSVHPYNLQDMYLINDMGEKAFVLSGPKELHFSELKLLITPPQPGVKLSYGSILHMNYDAGKCRPCMFERVVGRCRRRWLCDFCHMHTKKVQGNWQGGDEQFHEAGNYQDERGNGAAMMSRRQPQPHHQAASSTMQVPMHDGGGMDPWLRGGGHQRQVAHADGPQGRYQNMPGRRKGDGMQDGRSGQSMSGGEQAHGGFHRDGTQSVAARQVSQLQWQLQQLQRGQNLPPQGSRQMPQQHVQQQQQQPRQMASRHQQAGMMPPREHSDGGYPPSQQHQQDFQAGGYQQTAYAQDLQAMQHHQRRQQQQQHQQHQQHQRQHYGNHPPPMRQGRHFDQPGHGQYAPDGMPMNAYGQADGG